MSADDAGGTGTTTDDGGVDIGLKDISPSWLKDNWSFFREFVKNPVGWLAGVIVAWIFDLWEMVLRYVDMVWSTLAEIPDEAVYQPLVGAFGPAGGAIQDTWRDIGTVAVDVAEVAGPAAPIVVVAIWLMPALFAVAVLYFVIGLAETYLPIGGIPGLRRLR